MKNKTSNPKQGYHVTEGLFYSTADSFLRWSWHFFPFVLQLVPPPVPLGDAVVLEVDDITCTQNQLETSACLPWTSRYTLPSQREHKGLNRWSSPDTQHGTVVTSELQLYLAQHTKKELQIMKNFYLTQTLCQVLAFCNWWKYHCSKFKLDWYCIVNPSDQH